MLKKRFPVISSGAEAYYSVETVTEIVLVACILHNYLMGIDPNEQMLRDVDEQLLENEAEIEEVQPRVNNIVLVVIQ